MAKRIKKLYVTTDWQTEGIVLRKCVAGDMEGVWLDDERVQLYSTSDRIVYTLGRNAFETEDEARTAVQVAARKKVESLCKQADKLEGTWLTAKSEQGATVLGGERWPWAARQMRQGRRVRRLSWSAGEYIRLSDAPENARVVREVIDEDDFLYSVFAGDEWHKAKDWELFDNEPPRRPR